MNVLRLVRKSIHTALLGKTSKIDDRRTRLLRNYVVREMNGSQRRRSKWYVADRCSDIDISWMLRLAKDGDRFRHPIIRVSEISARCSVTWT